jgi:hypothetical protein
MRTIARVTVAMTHSPATPTTSGRHPCLVSARKLVRRPTPAKVNRNAQRDRLARSVDWARVKKPAVANPEIRRNPRTNFGKLLPQERGLVRHARRSAPTDPVERVAEHDEADRGVAGCLRQYGEPAGGVRVKRAGGGCLSRVVDRQADPQPVRRIAHAKRMADERKQEEADCAEREDRGNGV